MTIHIIKADEYAFWLGTCMFICSFFLFLIELRVGGWVRVCVCVWGGGGGGGGCWCSVLFYLYNLFFKIMDSRPMLLRLSNVQQTNYRVRGDVTGFILKLAIAIALLRLMYKFLF